MGRRQDKNNNFIVKRPVLGASHSSRGPNREIQMLLQVGAVAIGTPVIAQQCQRKRHTPMVCPLIRNGLFLSLVRLELGPPCALSRCEQQASIDTLYKRTIEISMDVQSMSHELHSSKLEYLGIVAAISGAFAEAL
jgi:hypothetical protein